MPPLCSWICATHWVRCLGKVKDLPAQKILTQEERAHMCLDSVVMR
jgi:hypothetical protein